MSSIMYSKEMTKEEKRLRMDWLKHRIKDFENEISDEKKEMEELKDHYRDKMDELFSNIVTLGEQRERWKDECLSYLNQFIYNFV